MARSPSSSPIAYSSLRRSPRSVQRLSSFALGPVLLTAAGVTALLLAFAGRYGYHRDELYFLAAGRHLAWGYPDQPPLVPLIARLVSAVAPDSLVALRTPSAVAMGIVVVLTGLSARELGGTRAAQVLAALTMAVAGLTLGMGHLLSTSTFALLACATIVWLVLRVLRTGDHRLLVVVGVVTGVGTLAHYLVALTVAGLFLGVVLAGPRDLLRSGWLWAGAAVALLIWMPNLMWQAGHDWPQVDMSRAIASGESGTSEPRSLFIPAQLLQVGPLLAPIWVAGLVALLGGGRFAAFRAVAVGYVVLTGFYVVTGGKPYYLVGFYPALLAVGAQLTVSWLRGGGAVRRGAVAAAVVLSAVTAAVVALPVVPVRSLHKTSIVDMNYDAGEQVGWPAFTGTVEQAWQQVPAAERGRAVVLAGNYGEAGAVERYGQDLPVYSGHNGYGLWGPPPPDTTTVVAVGIPRSALERWFTTVAPAGRVDNRVDVDNDEQGTAVFVCHGPRRSWRQLWPEMTHLG